MKTIQPILALFLCGTLSLSAAENIQWIDDYETAIAEAQKSQKPVFMVFMNSHSCSPCIRLDKNVLKSAEFKTFVDESVVPCKIDYGSAFKSPPGQRGSLLGELKKKSKVPSHIQSKGWPHVFLLASNGDVLHKSLERRRVDAKEFVESYQKILETRAPSVPKLPFAVHDKSRPLPEIVKPKPESELAEQSKPPAGAVVLFDGKDLSAFNNQDWKVENGYMETTKGNQVSKHAFGDCHLHLEWMVVNPDKAGNSGVYMMNRYELQIFNSYNNKTPIYPDGQAAAIYGQYPPKVNACRPQGEWEYFDIHFTAPKWDEQGTLVKLASVTMYHNGILVHDQAKLTGPTSHKKRPAYQKHKDKEPFLLQDHGNKLRFRNIWVLEKS